MAPTFKKPLVGCADASPTNNAHPIEGDSSKSNSTIAHRSRLNGCHAVCMQLLPQEYDPSLAEKTLAMARDRGDAAVARKKRNMLASLVRRSEPLSVGWMSHRSRPIAPACRL